MTEKIFGKRFLSQTAVVDLTVDKDEIPVVRPELWCSLCGGERQPKKRYCDACRDRRRRETVRKAVRKSRK